MGRIVIAVYQPKPGQSDRLKELVHNHYAVLRGENLVTERQPIMMESSSGALIEVFEWLSDEAIQGAHSNTEVMAMWQQFAEACDYVPIADCPEASQMFSEFTPI